MIDQKSEKELRLRLYRQLYTIRVFETECIKLYRKGDIRGYFHPYLGEEAIAVGVCSALRERDYIISTHRGHGHCIAKGAAVDRMIAELLGKESGYCRGRGGSMHIADLDIGNLGANGIVGAGIPIGVGAALGSRVRGEDRVVAIFFSDGATNNGVFSEAMNLAAIWSLPVILVIENNQYAVSTPITSVSRTEHLYVRGDAYGVESSMVDGNDVLAVRRRAQEAAQLCLAGNGPALIEAVTYRHGGHHVNDPGAYMPREKLDYYRRKDPILIGRNYLLEVAGEDEIAALEESVDKELEEAVISARSETEPDAAEFLKELENY